MERNSGSKEAKFFLLSASLGVWHVLFSNCFSWGPFSNNSMEVQLFALTIIRKLISSDCGVQAVMDAMVIPRLVELLDLFSESATDVVCQSALVLSHMALYQQPCMAMVNAGVIADFGRLLLCPISNKMLAVVATTIAHCATQHRYIWNRHNLFSHDVLQTLINLLFFSQAEVWLAAAMAIGSIAAWGDTKIRQHCFKERVPNHLCYLFMKCTNSLALETVACAIGRIFDEKKLENYYHADFNFSDYACSLLARLLGHGEMQMGAIRALRSIANTFADTEWRGAPIHKTFILKLTTFLAGDNDELFVEAALTTLQLMFEADYLDYTTDAPQECITMVEVRRLIHLLSYDKEWVAGRAALAIGKIANYYFLRDVDQRLIASCGVRPLICLLSSSNLDVVRTATLGRAFFA
jgi:hypothetical protein